MSEWRNIDGGAERAVIIVAVDASKEMSDHALEWAISNVVRPKDALMLLALLKSTTSSGKTQPLGNESTSSNFLAPLLKKLGRQNNSKESSNGSIGFEDKGIKWIYEACLYMLKDHCCDNHVEKVKAQVKVVPCASISSVAKIAEEQRANWVILDRRLKNESEYCMRWLNCNIITVDHTNPKILKLVNSEARREESEKADLRSVLNFTYESSSVSSNLLTSSSNTRSSMSSSDQEHSGTLPSISAGEVKFLKPAFHCKSTKKLQKISSPLPLPPGMQSRDDGSGFKVPISEGITKGRMSLDLSSKPRSESRLISLKRHSFQYKDTVVNNTGVGTHEQITRELWPLDSKNTTNKTETKPTTGLKQFFKDNSIGVPPESSAELTTLDKRPRLCRTSSIRQSVSLTAKHPRMLPPLCSVCRHNAPVFGKPPRKFAYKELVLATDGFSKKTFLAEGGYGPVYRGELEDGQVVAVKKHKEASAQGAAEFCSEVEVLSCAQHKNLVMLVGYCVETEWLLVYEFACNGSLGKHLHGNGKEVMAWKNRQKVATGTAKAMRYLHEDCRVGCIVHRDLRPNNILLTHDFEAMVGDFGLARWQMDGQRAEETRIVGTVGYLAPEYTQTGQITEKADVYAFGVLLLELISGVKAIDIIRRDKIYLCQWATPLIEKMKVHELVDARLKGKYDKQEVECMIHVAGLCISHEPETRPRMSKVLRLLEGDIQRDKESQHAKIMSSNAKYKDNALSHRRSKTPNPVSRSAYSPLDLHSKTATSISSSNGSASHLHYRTPSPPSRLSDNPSRLRSQTPSSISRVSDTASYQRFQTSTTPKYSDSTPHFVSKTPPSTSRANTTYLPLLVRSATTLFFEESQFLDNSYGPHEEEELRSNNIVELTPRVHTDIAEVDEMEEVNYDAILDKSLTSREYQAYLHDSFFEFMRNMKGAVV